MHTQNSDSYVPQSLNLMNNSIQNSIDIFSKIQKEIYSHPSIFMMTHENGIISYNVKTKVNFVLHDLRNIMNSLKRDV